MTGKFSEESYNEMLAKLFVRFPSFQKVGAGAYKPGTANMEFADQLMGHPHRKYKIVHVAGTNGKGSVSNMLTSALAAAGYKVGLYTSPHIVDFRERIRVVEEISPRAVLGRDDNLSFRASPKDESRNLYTLIPKEDVWSFVQQWQDTFDHLDMSFFEITTLMALDWFARQEVDIVVLETGLGGRLDSTNIVTPVLSVITNIGLDHCDMLGETLPEIAFEKAGIIKPCVPVVVGESHPETDSVFERKVLYTNLPEPSFMGNRNAIMSLLTFADKTEPTLWDKHEEILAAMDLQGTYQHKNLRTALAALSVLLGRSLTGGTGILPPSRAVSKQSCGLLQREACGSRLGRGPRSGRGPVEPAGSALVHTAARTGFRGRWEKISDNPVTICDIGHNEHGLKYNFAQLERMKSAGEFTHLIIVYGSVADKDVDAVIHLMPEGAVYVFTQAHGKRALPAEKAMEKYMAFCRETGRPPGDIHCVGTVVEARRMAEDIAASIMQADPCARPMIYIGGSTYVVSEAVTAR